MKYGVITRVAAPETGGNMATPLGHLYLSTNGHKCRQIGGIEQMAFRIPVFTVGEIIILDTDGREVAGRGRKPSKWDVTCETFDDLDEAIERALLARLSALPPDEA